MIMKPDASKQHKPGDVRGDREASAQDNGLCRCNCELIFNNLEDVPANPPMHFCNPLCEQAWITRVAKLTRQARLASGAWQMTASDKCQQDRGARLADRILVVLAGASNAEAGTALMLAAIATAYWRTSDATTRLQAVDEFWRQARELVQREDIIKQIEAAISWTLQVERS
jgi:hypothetical protein